MLGVNKAIIVGHVGQDADIRYSPSGVAVTTFSVATNRLSKSKEGERLEHTEWHRVVALGKTGELAGQLVKRGVPIYLEGRLQTKDWEDKEGRKRRTTEIIARNFNLLNSRGAAGSPGGEEEADIPF